MTSVLRYRAGEDPNDISPPKPHRLKPLDDEDFDRTAGDGATKSEDATAAGSAPEVRPPDRPLSAENSASPKTRMIKGVATTGLAETADSMSGASTADTVAPLESSAGEILALPGGMSGMVVAPPASDKPKKQHNRASIDLVPEKSRNDSLSVAAIGERNRASSVHGTLWTQSVGEGSAKLQQRRSMVQPPAMLLGANAREICNFYYRQAEQRWLWSQMQHRVSDLGSEGVLAGLAESPLELSTPLAKTSARRVSELCGLDVLGLLANDEEPPKIARIPSTKAGPPIPENEEANPVRGSVYILHGEADPDAPPAPVFEKKKSKKNKGSDKVASSTSSTAAAPAAEPAAVGPHPLKDLITAKKVDMVEFRKVFAALPVESDWINTPLDLGPPLIPQPIVFAVGMNDPALVDLIIDLGADCMHAYNGPSMYKGWVKPGLTLVQCVQNRKGRFVGTMLADKLTDIEMKLIAAVAAQHAKAAAAGQDEEESDHAETEKPDEEIQIVEEHVEAAGTLDGEPSRRKSVAVKISGGSTMRHTQGHPGEVFEISEHLCDGDRSSVWLGFHKETKSPVAIKTEHKSTAIEAWLWEEINLMRKVDEHPNIAKLFETFESEKQIFMVLELCEGGRLSARNTKEDCAVVLKSPKLMRQTTMAVDFLHGKGIAHRDIQLDNFLLADDKPLSEAVPKLIDFTTSKLFGPDLPLKTKICTPGYVAKEILTRKEVPYTEKVDVWSLGVVFFMMLSGTPPFYGETDFDTLKQVKKGVFKFEPEDRWAPVPEEAKQLICGMINPKVEDRLSASAVLAHPFLANAK